MVSKKFLFGIFIMLKQKSAFSISISNDLSTNTIRESKPKAKQSHLPSTLIFTLLLFGITTGLTLKLCAAIGVIKKLSALGVIIGPPTLMEYAVEPVGVANIMPSAQ